MCNSRNISLKVYNIYNHNVIINVYVLLCIGDHGRSVLVAIPARLEDIVK